MTIRNLCFLAIRLFGLFYFLKFIQSIYTVPYIFSETISSTEIITSSTLILTPLLISIILFFGAKVITKLILKSEFLDEEGFLSIPFIQLSALAFAGVGIYLFVDSATYTVGRIESYFFFKDSLGGYTDGNDQIKSIRLSILISLFKVTLSLLLIIGSKKIADWWIKFRNWT